MIKIRYLKLRLNGIDLHSLPSRFRNKKSALSSIQLDDSLVIKYTLTRYLNTSTYLDDGTELKSEIPTMEKYSARLFQSLSGQIYFSLLNPPRGGWLNTQILNHIFGEGEYFSEPLEIERKLIDRHISKFEIAHLVSAKIRDFRVYENAIGRLEITSKDGLPSEIAPFLDGRFHRVDSLTYDAIHNANRGLITYMTNGTVRAADCLAQSAFPDFELLLP